MARPLKPVNPRQVYRLARIGCTSEEIATVCEVSVDTLERRFADVVKKGREKCKMSLRRLQLKIAHSGNPAMAIWLGKQMLRQTEKVYSINVSALTDEQLEQIVRGADPFAVAGSSSSRAGAAQEDSRETIN